MNEQVTAEIEAAVFRRMVQHLRDNSDVQNIDLMILAGFCRNCLSKWYKAAAEEKGMNLEYEDARKIIYGMAYGEWKSKFETEATPEQLSAYAARQAKDKANSN
jgi:uncharacterized protein